MVAQNKSDETRRREKVSSVCCIEWYPSGISCRPTVQLCERHNVYFARFNGNVLLLTQFMATFLHWKTECRVAWMRATPHLLLNVIQNSVQPNSITVFPPYYYAENTLVRFLKLPTFSINLNHYKNVCIIHTLSEYFEVILFMRLLVGKLTFWLKGFFR